MIITTGFGYIVRNDVNSGEICLPIGAQYNLSDGEQLIEVSSREELNNVVMVPPVVSEEISLNQLISDKIKKIATDALVADGAIAIDNSGSISVNQPKGVI